jgi:tetratricopeptide (TPR) repeat protein
VKLFGPAPWHFHLLNVIAHLASCALVFLIGMRLRLTTVGATCAMLLFGLHPVGAEPVAWITGRKDVLATFLGLSTLLLAWSPTTRARRTAALLSYVLGLLAKPAIAPVCVLVAIAHAWFGRDAVERGGAAVESTESSDARDSTRTRVIRALRVSLPYFAVLAPVVVLGLIGQHAAGALSDPERAGASFARATWYAFGHHLRLLLGLEEPTAKYLPLPWPPGFTPMVDLMPLMAAGAAGLVVFVLPPIQRRVFGFGLLWAGLTYLPSSNLIPLVRYLADSYVYLPLVGAAWCAGAIADALTLYSARTARVLRYALPLLIAVACIPPYLSSQARFADDRALWAHALKRYPYNPRVCRQWANGVAKVRGDEPGLRATDRCLEIFGDELFAKNKGVLLGRLGRYDEARQWLERARQRHPSDPGLLSALANLIWLMQHEASQPGPRSHPPTESGENSPQP